MYKIITLDCQTKMVNLCCEDCLARKECKIHETKEKKQMHPKDVMKKATAEQEFMSKHKGYLNRTTTKGQVTVYVDSGIVVK